MSSADEPKGADLLARELPIVAVATDDRVIRLKSPEDCEQFARNALERNRPDLANEAWKKAIKLRAETYGAKTQLKKDCVGALYAYEEVMIAKNLRKTRRSILWQVAERHGPVRAVERAVIHGVETPLHTELLKMGLQDYAFEAVVVRYSLLFSVQAVRRSRKRVTEMKRALRNHRSVIDQGPSLQSLTRKLWIESGS